MTPLDWLLLWFGVLSLVGAWRLGELAAMAWVRFREGPLDSEP